MPLTFRNNITSGHIISQVFYFSAPEVVDVTNETRTLEHSVFYRRLFLNFFIIFEGKERGQQGNHLHNTKELQAIFFFTNNLRDNNRV